MPFEFKRFKAAAVQAAPVFMDKDATIEKACKLISEAGRNGAELIVFPETYIPTYPYWAIDYSESTIFAVGAALDRCDGSEREGRKVQGNTLQHPPVHKL
ncbi:MAG: nitrilase-related carbon-nitrogen hydrolase [Candidatus Freyarchaeota archaeon]